MILLYFRHKQPCRDEGIKEFVVLCDEEFEVETIKEHAVDGFEHKGTGDLTMTKGDESELPSDRSLSPD